MQSVPLQHQKRAVEEAISIIAVGPPKRFSKTRTRGRPSDRTVVAPPMPSLVGGGSGIAVLVIQESTRLRTNKTTCTARRHSSSLVSVISSQSVIFVNAKHTKILTEIGKNSETENLGAGKILE